MKKLIAILLATLILILSGCRNADPDLECQAGESQRQLTQLGDKQYLVQKVSISAFWLHRVACGILGP